MIIATKYDWPKIREAYVNECPKPSYEELAVRFNVPSGTLGRVASSESWPQLRVAALQQSETTADALEVLNRAASTISITGEMGVETCRGIFEAASNLLAELNKNEAGLALRARTDMLNTLSFAAQNAANAAARLGAFSMPGMMKKAAGDVPGGLDGRGQWSPSLLQALNITINGMQAEKRAEPEVVSTESVPTPDESDATAARLRSLKQVKT